jgi:hypothetical protein
MAADEARVVDRRDDRALRRADVGHHAVLARGGQHRGDRLRQRADRHRHERDVRAVDRLAHRACGVREGAELDRAVEHVLSGVEAANDSAETARGEPDRPADEPHADHGHDGPARTLGHQTFDRTLPATAAARSTCSAYSAN